MNNMSNKTMKLEELNRLEFFQFTAQSSLNELKNSGSSVEFALDNLLGELSDPPALLVKSNPRLLANGKRLTLDAIQGRAAITDVIEFLEFLVKYLDNIISQEKGNTL